MCTLNSVTGSGYVKYQESPLACKLYGKKKFLISSGPDFKDSEFL